MKFRSKILFPIVALVGLIPCITSCYHEPSYKVIGHAKITDFTITNFGDSSESSRTSLLIPVPVIQPSGDHHILPISDYEPDARLNTMIEPQLAPPDFDEYLNYLFEVKMSIQFNISSLDSSTANWIEGKNADPFAHLGLDLSRFHFSTYTYQEMDKTTPQPPQASQATYFPTYSNRLEPNVPGTLSMNLIISPLTNSVVTWDIDMVTCLGQIYGLKLLDPTDPTSWIRTAPYSAFEKITNVQNQLRLNDAYNSYISTPNGNRFDFIVDPDTQNTFFTFAGSLI